MSRPPSSEVSTTGVPPSVSLVGSFRQHYPQVHGAAEVFVAAGFAVKSPPLAPLRDCDREFVLFESDPVGAGNLVRPGHGALGRVTGSRGG
jgi:hypothetical protein